MNKHILFDLDGTLIDSAPSILKALSAVLEEQGVVPIESLHTGLIGPPIRDILLNILSCKDHYRIDDITAGFIKRYDESGFRDTQSFSGVSQVLESLSVNGALLYVVTNKRLPPTRLIVEHLGWQGYFTGLYSLDAFDPKLKSKAEVLDRVIAIHSIPKEEALYVGDRFEDLEAATVAGLGFVGVCWGYGTLDSKHVRVLQNPIDLNSLFDFGY